MTIIDIPAPEVTTPRATRKAAARRAAHRAERDALQSAAEAALPTSRIGRIRRLWPELAVALGSLVLFGWAINQNGTGNSYYAAAVKSMTQSWKAFFYASFDPGSWVTVDKPPFAFWLQAASAKVFGYSSWSILLPSAVCGSLSVWLLTATVRRAWGRTAGLVAGIALALTPMMFAVSRSNNPDAAMVLCVVAAAWATGRAIESGKTKWVLLIGAFCGFGFLAKLLAAAIVMPALFLAYLVAGKAPWKTRMVQLFGAGVAFALVAAIWVAGADLVGAGSRPYIGGSTDGTARDLVLGYNGLGRLTGKNGPGGGGGGPGGGFGGGGNGGGFSVNEFGGTPGIGRLFNNGMGDQVMWLSILAAGAFIGGTIAAVKKRRIDARLGSLIAFGGWAALTYWLFAFAEGTFHNYYVALLAPAIAALVGIGVGLAKEAGRIGRLFIAIALAATAALELMLLRRIDVYTWLRVAVPVALGIAAIGWAISAVRVPVGGRMRALLVGVSLAGALLAPAIWTWSGTQQAQSGSFPDSRPASSATAGGFGGGFGGGGGRGGGLSTELLTWLRSQQTTEKWLIAVSSSQEASSAIIGGDSVMAIGGFSGGDATMTGAKLAELVRTGQLRYISGSTSAGSAVADVCTVVPPSTWGGTDTTVVYDCQGKADQIATLTITAGRGPGGFGGGGPGDGGGFPGGAAPTGQAPTANPDLGGLLPTT